MARSKAEPTARLGGAVLAGGTSRRMGRDKAFIRIGGSSLVERAVAVLRAGGAAPVVVVGGDTIRIRGLGLDPVADEHPGAGPLGGILTALRHLDTPIVIVMACDHLGPTAEAVRAVVAALGSADVAVPVSEGVEQWLHSAWRRDAMWEVERAFTEGCRAPRELGTRLSVNWLLDGDPRWYQDADRPADLPDDHH